MRRFVRGAGRHAGASISTSLLEGATEAALDALVHRLLEEAGGITLITRAGTTLEQKFQLLCYWRQVIKADTN